MAVAASGPLPVPKTTYLVSGRRYVFDDYLLGTNVFSPWRTPSGNPDDKPFMRVGRFPAEVGNPNGGWNWAVCRYKRLRLPFIDFKRGRFEFYGGWRESGASNIKRSTSMACAISSISPVRTSPLGR